MKREHDPFDLDRFVAAQRQTHARALAEVRAGRKASHWMWYVFPQLTGLGSSPMAQRFAIGGLDEALAYLRHPELGGRLREITAAVAAHAGRTAHEVFGAPDDLKLCSSLTLFEAAAPDEPVFATALEALCDGQRDARTLALLDTAAPSDDGRS